jgi:hypothetical protein
MTENDDDIDPNGSDAAEEVDEDFDDSDLGDEIDEELVGDLEDLDEDALGEDDEEFGEQIDEVLVDEDEPVEEPRPRPRTSAEDKEDEDEEELDPDDVEADLDTILKDRLEAYDEGDDEEEEEAVAVSSEEGDLPQKREGEFPCPSCFLLVSAKQVSRTGYCPHCGDPLSVPAGMG